MSSPTQRSLAKLRKDGWFVAVVEKYNSFTRQRMDLWGFGDLLAIRGNDTMIVQTTSGSNVSKRCDKIASHPCLPMAQFWLESPTRRIEVHGWRKVGQRYKRKVWECRVMVAELITEGEAKGRIVWMEKSTGKPGPNENAIAPNRRRGRARR